MHRKEKIIAESMRCRRRGSLYPMVMGVTAIIACLAVAGLEMSRIAGKANQQLREQIEARRMAQAGLEYWQRQYNARNMPDPSTPMNVKIGSNSGFYLSAKLSPAGVDPKGAAEVTSIGRFGNAVQQLNARFEARPTLYDGFRCSLRSDTNRISFDDSTVYANHWSISKRDSNASRSNIFMDAMSGDSFSGSSSFKQRRIAGIPWTMQTASFNPTDPNYPGNAYIHAPGAVTIQPPNGDDQLISNSQFTSTVFPWYSNSSATLALDTTQGYSSGQSARFTNRVSGSNGPVIEVSRLLVKDDSYEIRAYVRPQAKTRFRWVLKYFYSNPATTSQLTSSESMLNAGSWNALSWNVTIPATAMQPDKVELGIVSSANCDFNFDAVTLYNKSRDNDIAYLQNTVLSDTFNPFSVDNAAPATSGIYIVDCRNEDVRIENCRIRSTLVFINCSRVDLRGGIVWEVPNRNYPAIIADAKITDNTRLNSQEGNSLRENDISFNLNPLHTPFHGETDTDFSDLYTCGIQGAILSSDEISLGNNSSSRGKIQQLTGPILAKNEISIEETTKTITFPSDMILNPPPGFYPPFTPMRLIPSSIDEGIGTQTAEVVDGELVIDAVQLQPIE